MTRLEEVLVWIQSDPAALCFYLGGLLLLAALIVILFMPVLGSVLALAGVGLSGLALRLTRGTSINPQAY